MMGLIIHFYISIQPFDLYLRLGFIEIICNNTKLKLQNGIVKDNLSFISQETKESENLQKCNGISFKFGKPKWVSRLMELGLL